MKKLFQILGLPLRVPLNILVLFLGTCGCFLTCLIEPDDTEFQLKQLDEFVLHYKRKLKEDFALCA